MFILYIVFIACRTLAVLINTSKSFFNYRHMTNIQSFRHSLTSIGFPSENILSISREDFFHDPRNIHRNKIIIENQVSLNYEPITLENLTDQYILNLFYLRHKFLYKLTEADNALFYICGHAAKEFFKVCDKYYMFSNDIMSAIKYLSSRLNYTILILDTCQASSLIIPDEIPSNTCVITTSNSEEYSYSSINSSSIGVSTIDDFAYSIFNIGIKLEKTIDEFFSMISDHLSSTVTCWGNSKVTLNDALMKNSEKRIVKFKID